MKHVTLALAAATVVAVGFSACNKAATPPTGNAPTTVTPATPEAKDVTPPSTPAPIAGRLVAEEIAGALSKAVCARMTICEKETAQQGQTPPSEADCTTAMTKDLAQALPEKARTVNREQLTICVASITKASCDELKASTPPKGCEFID